MRLLAVVAGACLFTGGMMMLPSWLYSAFPDPSTFFVTYGASPVAGPETDWESLGFLLVTVGILCGVVAMLWWVLRLIARLR